MSTTLFEEFPDLDTYLLKQKGKIIHQVWFGNIPNQKAAAKEYNKLQKYRESWFLKNPLWCHIEWDIKSSDLLVKNCYPEHYDMFRGYLYDIQRCDMVRYCFLHRYGGVYADMDYYCNKSLDIITNDYPHNFYLVQTPNMPGEYASNSLMFTSPGHAFWTTLLVAMQEVKHPPIYYNRHLVIMYTAGPGIVNKVYQKYKFRYNLKLYPSKYFQPLGMRDELITLIIPSAYTIHASKGSWHTNDSSIILDITRNWTIYLYIILIMVGINMVYYLFSYKRVG
jgi:mannosyltransferase OCH1-like enzyme